MSDEHCRFEADVIEASRSGLWSDVLRSHVTGCSPCDEARTVATFMSRAAVALGRQETAPDPTLIWLKAELARRDRREERERRTWIWSGAISGAAATVTAWVSIEWVLPIVRLYSEVFAMAGAAIALTLGILYFSVYRPLRNVRR
jgi:hypothetical protein